MAKTTQARNTLRKHIGQSLMIPLVGPSLLPEEKQFLQSHAIGGVILFKRNFESPQQLHALQEELQSLSTAAKSSSGATKAGSEDSSKGGLPLLFVGVDQEGGRVQRFKAPFTEWPSMQQLGQLRSTQTAFHFGRILGESYRLWALTLTLLRA